MIDTHVHYSHKRFEGDWKEVIEKCKETGIETFINCAIDFESNREMLALFADTPNVYYAVGIHPAKVGRPNEELDMLWFEELKTMADMKKVVAIGETGLDYHHCKEEALRKRQEKWFEKQLLLASEKELPVVLHIREAHERAIELLREHPLKESGVVHCFTGNLKEALIYIEEMGLYLGIGTKLLDEKNEELRKVVHEVPLERILLETDAPFLAPKTQADGRNTSLAIPEVAEKIAVMKGISKEKVIEQTTKNAKEFFGRV